MQALADDAKLTARQQVLIVGAAAAWTIFAVQDARHVGAQITGLCGPDRFAFVESIGADQVVDYRATDIRSVGANLDVVFATASVLDWRASQRRLKRGGIQVRRREPRQRRCRRAWAACPRQCWVARARAT